LRPFAAVAGRHPNAVIVLAGLGLLAAPLAVAAVLMANQARPLETCSSSSPMIVSDNGGLRDPLLRSEFIGIRRTSFVTVMMNGVPRRLPASFLVSGSLQQWQWRPAVQLRFIVPSIRFPEQALPRSRDKLKSALPSVAPKI
jgi:hypothetical protein